MIDSYSLFTSSKGKIDEYIALGFKGQIVKAGDLPESDTDPVTIILQKSIAAGPGSIVDDVSLSVEGCPYAGHMIKYYVGQLVYYVGETARYDCYIAVNEGDKISIYRGTQTGTITFDKANGKAFGFEDMFIPNGEVATLHDLRYEREDVISARSIAYDTMEKGDKYATHLGQTLDIAYCREQDPASVIDPVEEFANAYFEEFHHDVQRIISTDALNMVSAQHRNSISHLLSFKQIRTQIKSPMYCREYKALEKVGYIAIHRKPFTPNTYDLLPLFRYIIGLCTINFVNDPRIIQEHSLRSLKALYEIYREYGEGLIPSEVIDNYGIHPGDFITLTKEGKGFLNIWFVRTVRRVLKNRAQG